MNKIIAVLFGFSCFATFAVSSSILGVGMWFWIIITAGIFVAASQFISTFRELGGVVATIVGTIAVCAVILSQLEATIGGSFELDGSEALLVFSFAIIAAFGFSLARISRKNNRLLGNESQDSIIESSWKTGVCPGFHSRLCAS